MIQITGASGNVGREVVKQALAVGIKIRATFHDACRGSLRPCGIGRCGHGLRKTGDDSCSLAGVEKIFLVGPPVRPARVRSEFRERGERGRDGSTLLSFPRSVGGGRHFRAGIAIGKRTSKPLALPYKFLRLNGFYAESGELRRGHDRLSRTHSTDAGKRRGQHS